MCRKAASVFIAAAVFAINAAAQEENVEFTQTRAQFEKEVELAGRPIRERYLSRLEALKRVLGSRGDARGAAAVQDEIDRIREAMIGHPVLSKFAGIWKVSYNTGGVKVYIITPDGYVTHDAQNGKPPQTYKLVVKGNDVLLEIGDGCIERLRMNGKTMETDHYDPKSAYPAGQPNVKGTGTIVGR